MADASHQMGGDLVASASGDLLVVDSLDESTQRVLRRLSTNQNDYIWNPTYGAGLPRKVGGTLNQPELQSLIQSQMYLEGSVIQNPPPQIGVKPIPNGFEVDIGYVEADTAQPTTLSFQVTP